MLRNLFKAFSISALIAACSPLEPTDKPAERTGAQFGDKASSQTKPSTSTQARYYTDYAEPHICLRSDAEPSQAKPPPLAANSLWEQLPLGFQLDWQQQHPRLRAEKNWYLRHPEYLTRVTRRAEPYIYYISQQLKAHKLPQELALLPIVESAFDPFAYSHGRAAGMWQFIPGTARNFKLTIDWWYDGRRDVVASTQAAIRYLKYLHRHFDGDWMLALAAYNSGEGTVGKAVRKNRKQGKGTDFWSLDLPRETRSYVPKLLALSQLVARPQRYGLTLHPVADQPYFAEIDTGSQIDLAEAAALADLDIEELYRLNPGFNRWATSPDGPHRLLVPVAKAAAFEAKLTELPSEKRLHWVRHTVKSGESLLLLAKRYNTDAKVIRQVNKLRGNTIRVKQKLLIPVAAKSSQHYALSSDQRLQQTYRKRKGQSGSKQIFHQVRSGESLWTISRQYRVKVSQIAHWNGMAPKDPIRPGQKLSIWVAPKLQTASPVSQRKPVTRKVAYTVRQGDSLSRIASRFNVAIRDIEKWNPVKRSKYLQPGQQLKLYVDITRGVN